MNWVLRIKLWELRSRLITLVVGRWIVVANLGSVSPELWDGLMRMIPPGSNTAIINTYSKPQAEPARDRRA